MLSKVTRPSPSIYKSSNESKNQNNMFKTQNFQPKVAYQQPAFGSSYSFAVPSSRALQDNMDHSLYCQQRLFGGFHSYPYSGYKRSAQGEVRSTTEMKTKIMEQPKVQVCQQEKKSMSVERGNGMGSLLLTSMVNIKNEHLFGNEVKGELEKCKDSGDIQNLVISKFGQCNEMVKKLTLSYQQLGSSLDRIEGAVAEQFHVIANHIETNKEKIQNAQEGMSNHIIQQHNKAWKKLDKFGNGVKSFVQRSKSQTKSKNSSKVTDNIRKNVTVSKKQVSFIQTKIIAGSFKRSKSAVPPVRNQTNAAKKKSLKRKSYEMHNQEKSELNPQLKKVKLVESNGKEESKRMITRSFLQLNSSLPNPMITAAPASKKVTFSK